MLLYPSGKYFFNISKKPRISVFRTSPGNSCVCFRTCSCSCWTSWGIMNERYAVPDIPIYFLHYEALLVKRKMFITPVTLTDITIKVGFCIHLSKIRSCAPCCKRLNLQILRSMTFWLLQRDFMSSAFHGRWLFGHISPWGKQITACWKLLRANYYHQHRCLLGQLQPSEALRLEHARKVIPKWSPGIPL